MDMISWSLNAEYLPDNIYPNKSLKVQPPKLTKINDINGNKSPRSINVVAIIGEDSSIPKPEFDHYETFMKIHKLNLFSGSIVGLKTDSSWKYNNLTRWTLFMLIFGTSIAVYSHLLVITKPTKLIEVFSLFSIIAPAFAKFNLTIKKNAKGPKAFVLKEHIDETFASIKLIIPIQTMALFVFVSYPIYSFVANNELVQLMPMQFPFIDQSTTSGFIVANLMMMKMWVWAYFGSVGFDIFLARMIDNYCALVKLLKQDVKEYIEMSKKDSGYSEKYRKAFFRNFLIKCQDKDRYIQLINDLYADVIFKQFGMAYICLNFTIYAIIRSNWYSGYVILAFCLVEMYILCILGSAIKTENDDFCGAIYEIPWYDYSLYDQKNILLLLHSSQNAMELWIGPFAPLNVETN